MKKIQIPDAATLRDKVVPLMKDKRGFCDAYISKQHELMNKIRAERRAKHDKGHGEG